MKQFIILLFCSIILFSCKKEEQVISIQQEEEITENKPPTCAQTRFVKINLDVIDVHNRFMATFFLTEKD